MKKKFEKVKQGASRLVVKLNPTRSRPHSPVPPEPGSLAPESSTRTPGYADPKAPATALGTTGSVIHEFLAAARDGADLCLPLKAALVGAVKIFEICERTIEVREQYNTLKSRLAHLGAVTGALSQRRHKDPSLMRRLDDIADSFSRLTTCIEEKQARGTVKRVLESRTDVAEIKDLLIKISSRIEVFVFESIVRVELGVEDILERLPTAEEKQAERELANWRELTKVIRSALGERRVHGAAHEAQPSDSGCMNGTRAGTLSKFVEWVKNDPKSIFWLAGMAGTGKTSIAITLCRMFQEDPDMLLGGTFFCSRTANEEGRSDVRRIIPTLAAHLADISPIFASQLATELRPNSGSVVYKPTSEQFAPLLQRPLDALELENRPIVFIIDALDECSDERELSALLKELATLKYAAKVKFILTSRPETHILGSPISNQTRNEILHLHTIGPEDVTEDIRMYIGNKFNQNSLGDTETWFSDADVRALAKLANGLFIFASTVITYIIDTDTVYRRKDRLQTTLSAMKDSKVATGPLDAMYEFVITRASTTTKVEPHELAQTQRVLASILSARMPLSLNALGELFGEDTDVIRESLRRLRAVIHVPDEPDQPGVRALHASFGDYLFERAGSDVRIARSLGDDTLARGCLRVLAKRLHFNVSKSRSSHQANPPSKPDFIPLALEYACLQWIYHVSGLAQASSLDKSINEIFRPRLLFWLEVMSVLGHVLRASAMLMFAAITVRSADLSQFLRDANVFVASSREAIERSAPHIYISALPFSSKDSLIYQTFLPMCKGIISVDTYGIDRHGGRLVMTLAGHEDEVTSAEYSPDGRFIGSSSKDGTVRIWNPRTGEEDMSPLRSGDGKVFSIAFAPNSRRLASGTKSGVICVWNISSIPAIFRRLFSHTGSVQCVIFSPDGSLIASASKDKTARLFNADTGDNLAVMIGHYAPLYAVTFSPDGRTLASCSDNHKVRFWHAATGEAATQSIKYPELHAHGISFSPDSTIIACGSSPSIRPLLGDIQLWDLQSHTKVATLEIGSHFRAIRFAPHGQSIVTGGKYDGALNICDLPRDMVEPTSRLIGKIASGICTVAFSPDGSYIVAAYHDGIIRIWDTGISVKVSRPLEAHREAIYVVATSSNGTLIVSGSSDKSVRVWDIRSGKMLFPPLLGHTGGVVSLSLSLDGNLIASGATDGAIILWNMRTGELVDQPMTGYTIYIKLLTFSPNSRLLASGLTDKTIRIWDVFSGKPSNLSPLLCQDSIRTISFSPDGQFIAAGDFGGRIYLWYTETGQPAHAPLNTVDTTIWAIKFTPDDTHTAFGEHQYRIPVPKVSARPQAPIPAGPDDYVYSVVYSSDNRFIASSVHQTVRLWDCATGALLATACGRGREHRISSVVFTPDNRTIVAGFGTAIRAWDVESILALEASSSRLNPVDALGITELKDGWLEAPSGELLLWIPEDYRAYTQVPPCTMLIANYRVVITADPGGLHAGEEWTSCWTGSDTS